MCNSALFHTRELSAPGVWWAILTLMHAKGWHIDLGKSPSPGGKKQKKIQLLRCYQRNKRNVRAHYLHLIFFFFFLAQQQKLFPPMHCLYLWRCRDHGAPGAPQPHPCLQRSSQPKLLLYSLKISSYYLGSLCECWLVSNLSKKIRKLHSLTNLCIDLSRISDDKK